MASMKTAPASQPAAKTGRHRWLQIIGALKLLKGAFFVALGFALLRMLHHDIYMRALQVVEALHLDPDRVMITKLLDKVSLVTDHRLKQLSALIFIYASVDFTEGTGLVLEKRWAEYFTLVITIALLPLEAYKLIRHPNHWTALILLANAAVAVYLVWLVRVQHIARNKAALATAPR